MQKNTQYNAITMIKQFQIKRESRFPQHPLVVLTESVPFRMRNKVGTLATTHSQYFQWYVTETKGSQHSYL